MHKPDLILQREKETEMCMCVSFLFSLNSSFLLSRLRGRQPPAGPPLVRDGGNLTQVSACVLVPVLYVKSQISTITPGPPLTMNLVDLGVLRQYFVGQFLCGGQHLCVMHCDQVLDKLLQLISVHLEESL